jgi:alkylhydroperoxidase family enzyme
MSLARPARPRVDPDPDVLAANRGQYTANVVGTLGLNPEFSKAFSALGRYVVIEASTPRRQRELVILRTGWNCGAQYEFGQHTIFGREAGVTEAEIVALTRPLITFPWAEEDRILLEMADELYTDCCVTDATWAKLAARWTPSEILEFIAAVGMYFLISSILNTFGVELDEGVPGWPQVAPPPGA